MDEGSERTFLQGRGTNGQQAHEKRLHIAGHLGETDEITSSHTCWDGCIKKVGNDRDPCGCREIFVLCDGEINGAKTLENRLEVPQNVKETVTI